MRLQDANCPECGTPSVRNNAQGNNDMNANSLKKRSKYIPVKRPKHAKTRGFIGGLACLAALVVMAYYFAFDNLLAINIDGVTTTISPLVFSATTFTFSQVLGDFILFTDYQFIIDYFTTFIANVGTAFGSLDSIAVTVQSLPALLFQLMYFISALLVVLGLLFGVLKLLFGLFGKKEFNLLMPLGLGLTGYIMMFAMLSFSLGDFTSISWTSGLMFGIYAGVGAIIIQVILNIGFAGTRFAKGGSVVKWLTNLGLFGGAVFMLKSLPIFLMKDGASVSPLLLFATSLGGIVEVFTSGDTGTIMEFAYNAGIAIYQMWMLFTLSSFVVKTAKRWANTFKFDGYEDKSFLGAGIRKVILVGSFSTIVYLAGYDISSIIMFAVSAVCILLLSLINRVVLNKDQKASRTD